MTVIVRGSIPADEFALNHVLCSYPDVEFDIERVVKSGEDAVMPLVWVRGTDREDFEQLLEEDETVNSVSLLADLGDEYLYRMEWVDQVILLLDMLTSSKATILDAYGRNDRWTLRVMYPDRERFSDNYDFAEDVGVTFEIESIRELDEEPAGRFGLTKSQYETLITAVEHGYFEVPRDSSLEDLAEKFDVSHQALSERLRRGMKALVEDALVIGHVDEDEE
ncbi:MULTISPECIES: helix-turn-helix domain-containing protein [unclassified Haladaptatus]|uniref:helix-turn-helix domain-containing protein n=1 Tax=unclassified Haladaptatus TaxID=2622732 RepID=UPI0023E7924E|nr:MULTISPECIES: helix-turn-helix domain-containing protein [unclassified Haladaptatus]